MLTNYKAQYKNELAAAAGVSMRTFRRWLHAEHRALCALGYNPKDKLLPPSVVKYLCEKYVITFENHD